MSRSTPLLICRWCEFGEPNPESRLSSIVCAWRSPSIPPPPPRSRHSRIYQTLSRGVALIKLIKILLYERTFPNWLFCLSGGIERRMVRALVCCVLLLCCVCFLWTLSRSVWLVRAVSLSFSIVHCKLVDNCITQQYHRRLNHISQAHSRTPAVYDIYKRDDQRGGSYTS